MVRTNDVEVLKAAKNEFIILKKLEHPNIVKARAMYFNPLRSCLYLIQEQANGIELSDYIAQKGRVHGTFKLRTV